MDVFTITGLYPSWYLSRLVVKDIQSNKQWYFVCDNWLAVESEDGKVCRVIPVANDQELTNFNQLFTARTVKGKVFNPLQKILILRLVHVMVDSSYIHNAYTSNT